MHTRSGNNLHRAARPRAGFTILEMLVVGVVGVVVIVMIANSFRWFSRSVLELRIGNQIVRDIKSSTDALAQDYGSAVAVRTLDGKSVQFNMDGPPFDGLAQWALPDTIVQYSLQSGQLLRRDLGSGLAVPVANNITKFEIVYVSGKPEVRLTAQVRKTPQTLKLKL